METNAARYIHWHDNTNYAISDFTVNHIPTGETQRNIWHHCTLAVDSDNGILAYTNGNPITVSGGTVMNGGHITGVFWIGETNNIQGVINDVRIYKNEILSPREIKEISKGLVLHYPLNRGGFGQDNLLKASNEYVTNSSYCIKSYYFGDDPPQEGEEVTIQIKGHLADTKSYWNVYNSGGSVNVIALFKSSYNEATGIYTATGNWVITKGTTTATNKFINVYAFTSSQSGESTIEWIKLERGSTATPWIPNSADDLYSAMGLDNGIEYDVSGYGNNGSVTGSLAYSSDTPRYLGSTYITNGSVGHIEGIPLPISSQTLCMWVKCDKTRDQCVFCDKNT